MLGFESVEGISPDRLLQEMGFDSLAAVELRNQLAAVTDLPIPVLALSDNPTPDGLARYLLAQSQGADEEEPSLVRRLGRALDEEDAGKAGAVERYMELLAEAAGRRPSFGDARDLRRLPRAARLVAGSEPVTVVLLSSVGPLSGPYEYVKLARALGGRFGVVGFPLPGFVEGEQLPASVNALSGAYAQALEAEGLEGPYVLAGHSSGGWVAHALADHLAAAGVPPVAAVLLDTYMPRSARLRDILPAVLRGAQEAARESPGMATARLTAMARYSALFADWRPAGEGCATVLVEAAERGAPSAPGPAGEWEEAGACDVVLSAPGDHFSIMDEQAESTARAIESALVELTAAKAK